MHSSQYTQQRPERPISMSSDLATQDHNETTARPNKEDVGQPRDSALLRSER